jgi:GH25 family lysozyme M1 (1,4-beta-N-acetylmuramidase)
LKLLFQKADDDDGFFRWKAWQYYQDGSLPIVDGSLPLPPTNLRIVSP